MTDARGVMAPLRNGSGFVVLLSEHPASLLEMLRAGTLAGQAKEDAVYELKHHLRDKLKKARAT
jgi:hypothetical protein